MSAPIIIHDLDGEAITITPTPADAERASFDDRANRALRGTMTGESMADWGPLYVREARAMLDFGQRKGQLWERVAEGRASRCACAHYADGSTITLLCPIHADHDPCESVAQVTGKRRKGTIHRGACTACGWREANK